MKAIAFIVPFFMVLLLGCNDASQPAQKDSSDDSVVSAPTDYLQSAVQSQKKAVKTIDLAAINKAIEAFYIQEGRFPKSLEELEEKNFMRAVPLPPPGSKLNYDTNSGVVTIEKDLGDQPPR